MQQRQPGQKGAQPEEVKGGLDARDLIGRFRSKQDIYEYLSHHRKFFPPDNLGHLGQFYMPPLKKITIDFLKEVFAGRKHLIPRDQVRPIDVPRYDELSVVHLIKDIMAQPELAKFFPEQKTAADLPDREYFFNIINTSDHGYLDAILKHAQQIRLAGKQPQDNENFIEVNEQWQKELQASPFLSRMHIS